jgi:hypothetical protein
VPIFSSKSTVNHISVSETFRSKAKVTVGLKEPEPLTLYYVGRPKCVEEGKQSVYGINGLRCEGHPKLMVQEQNIGIGSRKNSPGLSPMVPTIPH